MTYSQTAEWWDTICEATGKRHAEMTPKELEQHLGGVVANTWANRRSIAATRFGKTADNPEGVDFPVLGRGPKPIHNVVATGTPPSLPVEELTTAEKVERDREVYRLREENSQLKAKYKEATREHVLEERILTAISDHAPTLPAVTCAPHHPPAVDGSPETVVALMSDFHIGEVVSAEETGGLAWYDFTTFAARYQHYIDSILSISFRKLTGYHLPRLQVFMLGDMVSGIIHEELVETAEGTLMEWLLDGAHVIAQGLRDLAANFEQVNVVCVVGNHGRLQKQYRFKKRYANYDYLLYRILQLELADQDNVTFEIPKSFWALHEVEGHQFLLLHGDNIKSWAGIPWYGIERACSRLTNLLPRRARPGATASTSPEPRTSSATCGASRRTDEGLRRRTDARVRAVQLPGIP